MHEYISVRLHGVVSQKTVFFIVTAVRLPKSHIYRIGHNCFLPHPSQSNIPLGLYLPTF